MWMLQVQVWVLSVCNILGQDVNPMPASAWRGDGCHQADTCPKTHCWKCNIQWCHNNPWGLWDYTNKWYVGGLGEHLPLKSNIGVGGTGIEGSGIEGTRGVGVGCGCGIGCGLDPVISLSAPALPCPFLVLTSGAIIWDWGADLGTMGMGLVIPSLLIQQL